MQQLQKQWPFTNTAIMQPWKNKSRFNGGDFEAVCSVPSRVQIPKL